MTAFLSAFFAKLLQPLIENAVAAAFAKIEAAQTAKWKDELGEIQKKLAGTMTVEDKQNAAAKLAALIARL